MERGRKQILLWNKNIKVQSRPSKSERFNSLFFTLNRRRPKMSQFDTSVKKIIEGNFFKWQDISF
jgi:hypothetical protein